MSKRCQASVLLHDRRYAVPKRFSAWAIVCLRCAHPPKAQWGVSGSKGWCNRVLTPESRSFLACSTLVDPTR